MNIEEIPYLRRVEFSYTMKTITVDPFSSVTHTIGGELFVPTYMDPEWNVMCYLLAFPLKNDDPKYVKELVALTMEKFVTEDGEALTPWLSLNQEFPEEAEEVIELVEECEVEEAASECVEVVSLQELADMKDELND